MTLQERGNLGEFVAAIATVATLGYLAVQIRQNTQSVRASSYRGVIEGLNEAASLLAQDPVLASLYLAADRPCAPYFS